MTQQQPKAPFGLSQAEYENLRGGALYIATIVLAVTLTFVIIATITNVLGFTPTSPSSEAESTAESTEVLDMPVESTESAP